MVFLVIFYINSVSEFKIIILLGQLFYISWLMYQIIIVLSIY